MLLLLLKGYRVGTFGSVFFSQSRGREALLTGREPTGSGNDSSAVLSRFMKLFLKGRLSACVTPSWPGLRRSTAASGEPAKPQPFHNNNFSGQQPGDRHRSTGFGAGLHTRPRARASRDRALGCLQSFAVPWVAGEAVGTHPGREDFEPWLGISSWGTIFWEKKV